MVKIVRHSILWLTILILLSSSLLPLGELEVSPFAEIYTLSDSNITAHLWSPDAKEIAYVKCPDTQLWGCELWIADYKLQNNHLAYRGVHPYQLYDWMDDWILLGLSPTQTPSLDTNGRATVGELWKIRSDGTDLTRISSTYTNGIRRVFVSWLYPNIGTVGWAKFIPGTNLIYFSAHDGNGWWGPYTTTNDGSDVWSRIGTGFSFTRSMAPDGSKLVWGSSWYWNRPTTLYAANYDGTGVAHLMTFPVKTYPLVLADAYTIILSWPGNDIHAINMDGTGHRIVIADEYANSWSDYNPIRGDSFLMLSNRANDGNTHIFEIRSDGTGLVQYSDGAYDDYAAQYSPDGKMIAYRRLPADFDPSSGRPYPYQLVVLAPDETPPEIQAGFALLSADDDEYTFAFEYSVIDNVDPNPAVMTILQIPMTDTSCVKLRDHKRTKIKIDLEDMCVKIKGPDAAELWLQIQEYGGLVIYSEFILHLDTDDLFEDEIDIKIRDGKYFIEGMIPTIFITAIDESGNQASIYIEPEIEVYHEDDDDDDWDDDGDDD